MKQFDFRKDSDDLGRETVTVADRPKRKLDLFPRLICLIIAVVIWIYMTNVNDVDITREFVLNISIEGVDSLLDRDNMMIYGVNKNQVKITVSGSNRDLVKYDASDYSATVDVSVATTVGKHSLPINIKTPVGSSIILVSSEASSINLYSDYKVTKRVWFDAWWESATETSYTYSIGKNSDTMEITGPKAIVENIELAKFRIPDAGYYSSQSFSDFSVLFYDKNGDSVVYESGTVSYSTRDMVVTLNLTDKKVIPIFIEISDNENGLVGHPSESTVTIIGDPMLLRPIEKYTITLPRAYPNDTVNVMLNNDNLPEGISFESAGEFITISFSTP